MQKTTEPEPLADRPAIVQTIDIAWHPLVAKLPLKDPKHPTMIALRDDIEARGIDTPLVVCQDALEPGGFLLLDGRHRLRAAMDAGLMLVPVQVVPEAEASERILASIVHRNHFTKGQLAFLCVDVIEEQIAGRGGDRKSKTAKRSLIGREEICARYGIGRTLLDSARQVRDIFAADPDFAEKMQPKIFADIDDKPVSLGQVIAGYHGKEATEGLPLDRLKNVVPRCYVAMGTWEHAFNHWDKIPPNKQGEIRQAWGRILATLPESLRDVKPLPRGKK
ncbi:MAG: ParB/RepB/Spo0J family partition protein [Verrucomicrobiae bacterium]